MKVSNTEREVANRRAEDLIEVERLSALAVARAINKSFVAVRSALKAGTYTIGIVTNQMMSVADELVDAATYAHLKGREASLLAATAQMSKASKFLKAFLNVPEKEVIALRGRYAATMHKELMAVSQMTESKIQKALMDSIVSGEHVDDAVERLEKAFKASGLTPKSPFHLEGIFRTQMQIAYAGARWQTNQDPSIATYLWGYKYVTAGDDRVRPNHELLDGVTLPKDDPRWSQIFPPNGWACRCQAIEIFQEREIVEPPVGIQTVDGERVEAMPDEGFAFNPGEMIALQFAQDDIQLAPAPSSIGGQWITTKTGVHILVKEGQSVGDAVKERFGEKKEKKLKTSVSEKKEKRLKTSVSELKNSPTGKFGRGYWITKDNELLEVEEGKQHGDYEEELLGEFNTSPTREAYARGHIRVREYQGLVYIDSDNLSLKRVQKLLVENKLSGVKSYIINYDNNRNHEVEATLENLLDGNSWEHLKAITALSLAGDDADGQWITTKTGAKVFIKEGQSVGDAIRDRFGDQGDASEEHMLYNPAYAKWFRERQKAIAEGRPIPPKPKDATTAPKDSKPKAKTTDDDESAKPSKVKVPSYVEVKKHPKVSDEYVEAARAATADATSSSLIRESVRHRVTLDVQPGEVVSAQGKRSSGATGMYSNDKQGRAHISVGKRFMQCPKDGDLTPGKFNSVNSQSGVIAHEFGHVAYYEGKSYKHIVAREKWEKLYIAEKKWFKKNVSKYASYNHDEAYAETYAMMTHKNYKQHKLPKHIENAVLGVIKGVSGKSIWDMSQPKTVAKPKAYKHSVDRIADAIYIAEGGSKTKHPYGILKKYKTTTPRQACINTILHALRDWDGKGDFIEFLGRRYAPVGVANDPNNLNVNWIGNVKKILERQSKLSLAGDDADGQWITTKTGVHILVKEGQSVDDAVKERFGEKEKEKAEPVVEGKKSSTLKKKKFGDFYITEHKNFEIWQSRVSDEDYEAGINSLTTALKDGNLPEIRGPFRFVVSDKIILVDGSEGYAIFTNVLGTKSVRVSKKFLELPRTGDLQSGDTHVDVSQLGVLRHEFGHAAFYQNSNKDIDSFKKIFKAEKKSSIRKYLSEAGTKNADEFFGESVAKMLHPKFDKSQMPDHIQKAVKKLLERQPKLSFAGDDADGQWITTKTGVHILVKEGQSVGDAVNERFKMNELYNPAYAKWFRENQKRKAAGLDPLPKPEGLKTTPPKQTTPDEPDEPASLKHGHRSELVMQRFHIRTRGIEKDDKGRQIDTPYYQSTVDALNVVTENPLIKTHLPNFGKIRLELTNDTNARGTIASTILNYHNPSDPQTIKTYAKFGRQPQSMPMAHGWLVEESKEGTLRHELAHVIWNQAEGVKDVGVRHAAKKELARMFDATPKKDIARKVSSYATSHNEEFFAETFTMMTHKDYKPGSLPKEWTDIVTKVITGV